MIWVAPVGHAGTGERWHDPENAYQPGGAAWHDVISGHWSDPAYIDWSDWLQLQFDDAFASTSVKWGVWWVFHGPPNIIPYLHLQVYTGAWENVCYRCRPGYPGPFERSSSEKNISQMRIRFGSPYTFPRNNVEPRIHYSFARLFRGGTFTADAVIVVPGGTFTADAVIVATRPGRTYFFLG